MEDDACERICNECRDIFNDDERFFITCFVTRCATIIKVDEVYLYHRQKGHILEYTKDKTTLNMTVWKPKKDIKLTDDMRNIILSSHGTIDTVRIVDFKVPGKGIVTFEFVGSTCLEPITDKAQDDPRWTIFDRTFI